MALFSSVFRQLFERFAHFLRIRETPLRAQQCAAQERAALEKLPEASLMKASESEAFDFTAKNRKCRRRRRQYGEKEKERQVKRKVKKEGEMNEGASHKDKAEKERETLSLEKIKDRGHVPQKKRQSAKLRKMQSLENLTEGGTARFRPLPPVTKPPMYPQKPAPAPEKVSLPCSSLQVDPPKPLAVPPRPTPAPDELFSSDAPNPVKPQPSTSSLVEPPPQLMLIDIEDEETEYVEYTGKTIRACDLSKSERPRPLEAEMKPRRMVAWLESDNEVLEEVWASEVVEVQGCEDEKANPDEMGDSKVIEGHLDDASQKKELDEHMMKLFCVTSPEGPKNETQHNVNVQEEPKSKRKVPRFLFTWAEEKAKKKEEKKIRKEKEQREKELLFERYRNDPKLKHLLINKHNRHYCSLSKHPLHL
ncbi:hypothetical protein G5714_018691 [Onychostoma macrolepis]|uniref:Uncharacterized protein n=1 Tax=Onychostoma macrolepis TaxID=369639 RepID=A0A7J6C1J7_9TELE|nr:hypothetical protein G5714_018691 [Onychostoma macrolepis]